MPQVNVTINGRQFRMACEEGEESHLLRLAENLDQRISRLRERFGEIGDTRLTVMAALTLADELAETKERMTRMEPELTKLQEGVWPRPSGRRPRKRQSSPRFMRRPSASRASPGA